MDEPCRPKRLTVAQGPCCSVDACACGVLHVSVGALTLRVAPDAVESIWVTLGEAIHRLKEHQQEQQGRHAQVS